MTNPFIVTAPTNYPLVHYHRNAFNFEITVLNADTTAFDFTGYTGHFYIRKHEKSEDSEMDFACTFQDNTILLNQNVADYAALSAPRTYFYELILTDTNSDPTAWLAGRYSFTTRAQDEQSNTATIQFNNYNLTLTVGATPLSYLKSSFKDQVDLTGTKNGINAIFVIPVTSGRSLVTGSEHIISGRVPLRRGVDYTISGATATLIGLAIPQSGDPLWANFREE